MITQAVVDKIYNMIYNEIAVVQQKIYFRRNHMKILKRITSAILSLTFIASASSVGALSAVNTAAASGKESYRTILNRWSTKLSEEEDLLPNGKYWNHKEIGGTSDKAYSRYACDNNAEDCKYCCETSFESSYNSQWDRDSGKKPTINQCFGFAHMLAKDIWDTRFFVCHDVKGGKYTEPRKGDNVRLQFKVDGTDDVAEHSIFITDISGDNIEFADCNYNMGSCLIRWKADSCYENFKYQNNRKTGYNLVTVDKEFLKQYAIKVYRPIIKGDFNLNGKIDNDDVKYFKSTYIDYGNTSGNDSLHPIPTQIYDVNSDGKVTEADYQQIQYYAGLSYIDGYIYKYGDSVTYTDRNRVLDGCFIYNKGIYKANGNEASFVKPFFTDTTSFVVSSSVRDKNSKTYTVTAIGGDYISPRGDDSKLKSLVIPRTVTKIKKFAFSNTPISSITFNGSSSKLKTIESSAFYNCSKLTSLDLRYCPELSLIGDYAFSSCTALGSINLPYNMTTLQLGTSYGIFGSGKTNTTTIYINNLKTSTSPASNYQKLKFFGSADINYWKQKKVELYGKLFKVYDKEQYLCKKDTSAGYLTYPN